MEAYANVLLYAIPGFVGLIILEALYGHFKGHQTFAAMDTISSLSSGTTNTLKDILGLTLVIISYDWVYQRVALTSMETTWWLYLIGFVAIDFAAYWSHRLNHSINYFWNRHVIHHSGEHFNMATALRQSISEIVSLGFIFLFPAALIGIPPEVIAVIAPLHLFLQFWYHTEHIGKLGILEYIIVTPSQHRVHHAINPIYIDKNLAAIFCIWDRAFGTFQEELDEEPCVYGVTRQANTWNPIKINFQHLWLLVQDAWHAQSWKDKLRIWFMPTGWRPNDVAKRFPIPSTDYRNHVKYDTKPSKLLTVWSWVQFVVMILFLTNLLIHIADYPTDQLLMYGAFIFVMVYSFTSLMDYEASAFWVELIKSSLGFYLIYVVGDFFLIDDLILGGTVLTMAYFTLSVVVVGYLVQSEVKPRAMSLRLDKPLP